MKEKILKVLKSKLLFAVALNMILAILCVWVTSFSYANSSDFYNSILICRDHFYYSSTINYILAVIIGTIQYAVTDINAFVMVELALSFAAFTTCLTLSMEPMFPGLILILSAPFFMASSAIR